MAERKLSVEQAFQEQMCLRCYGAGNPKKPAYVVGEIRKWLTPVYLKLANKLQTKSISELKDSDCRFKQFEKLPSAKFICKPSPYATRSRHNED